MRKQIRRQFQNEIAEDKLETQILKIKPKLEMIDKVAKLNEHINDPTTEQQLNQERKNMIQLMNILATKFGVSIFDVYAKIEADLLRGLLLTQKDLHKKRLEEQKPVEGVIQDPVNEDRVVADRAERQIIDKAEAKMSLKDAALIQELKNKIKEKMLIKYKEEFKGGLEGESQPNIMINEQLEGLQKDIAAYIRDKNFDLISNKDDPFWDIKFDTKEGYQVYALLDKKKNDGIITKQTFQKLINSLQKSNNSQRNIGPKKYGEFTQKAIKFATGERLEQRGRKKSMVQKK